jgi:hypothetical protein
MFDAEDWVNVRPRKEYWYQRYQISPTFELQEKPEPHVTHNVHCPPPTTLYPVSTNTRFSSSNHYHKPCF